jgi:hypothetical protein
MASHIQVLSIKDKSDIVVYHVDCGNLPHTRRTEYVDEVRKLLREVLPEGQKLVVIPFKS